MVFESFKRCRTHNISYPEHEQCPHCKKNKEPVMVTIPYKTLHFLMDEIADGTWDTQRIDHDCEYYSNPEAGKCDFCEAWGELMGYLVDQGVID